MVHTDQVQLQITTLSKFFVAHVTVVRFLAGVRAIVLFQQVLEDERFRANVAAEPSLILVHGRRRVCRV